MKILTVFLLTSSLLGLTSCSKSMTPVPEKSGATKIEAAPVGNIEVTTNTNTIQTFSGTLRSPK